MNRIYQNTPLEKEYFGYIYTQILTILSLQTEKSVSKEF